MPIAIDGAALADAKAFLRIEGGDEDALLGRLLGVAADLCERFTGVALAAAWADVPDPLKQGVLRLAAHLYTRRDAADDAGPPAAVAALWRPFRRMRLA